MPDFTPVNALPQGTVLHGQYLDYKIVRAYKQDGFGVSYRATAVPRNPADREHKGGEFLIREHYMKYCSTRDESDSRTVIPYSDAEGTVEDFRLMFDTLIPVLMKLSDGQRHMLTIREHLHAFNTSYYATGVLGGVTLADYVKTRGALTIDETRELMHPMLVAVRQLHVRHIIHTDLSPQSILVLNLNGVPTSVLTRHYACKPFDEIPGLSWSLPPLSCPDGYAPPEQYQELDKFLPQTNIYSLAAIAVFCLTGKTPPMALEATQADIEAMLPDNLKPEIRSLLVRSMSPDYKDRPVTVTRFREEFLTYFQGGQFDGPTTDHSDHKTDDRNESILMKVVLILTIIVTILAVAIILIDTSSLPFYSK